MTSWKCESINTRLMKSVETANVEALKDVIRDFKNHPFDKLDIHQALCTAAQTGHAETVRLLLKFKADVTYKDHTGKRALHYAAELGSVDVVKQILTAGSPVNAQDVRGYTPLHSACEFGHTKVVALLLNEGANVNRSRVHATGEAPLHLACKQGRPEVVRLLLAKGANIDLPTTDGKSTPLHLAALRGQYDTVHLLCQLACDINKTDFKGRTALYMACQHSFVDIVRTLLEHGACPSTTDTDGRQALHIIAGIRNPTADTTEVAELVISLMTDLNHVDNSGSTPLHCASTVGNRDVVASLVRAGADIDARDAKRGETALMMAIGHNRSEVSKLLIAMGADVNIGDYQLMTPLHLLQNSRSRPQFATLFSSASSNEDSGVKLELVELLLQHGACLNTATEKNYTPLDRCVFHCAIGRFDADTKAVMKRLVAAGAHLKPLRGASGPGSSGGGRKPHNSPLCWLTWHSQLPGARFLVDAGWDLRHEEWIHLHGRDEATNSFLEWLREQARHPRTLKTVCRIAIREHLIQVTNDRDINPLMEELPLPVPIKKMLQLCEELAVFDQN